MEYPTPPSCKAVRSQIEACYTFLCDSDYCFYQSLYFRGSFRKKGGIIKPTVTVAVNNLADIDDIDTNTAVDILRRRYLKNIFYVS